MPMPGQKTALLLASLLLGCACTSSHGPTIFSKFDELEISRDLSSHSIATKPFFINVTGLDQLSGEQDQSTFRATDARLNLTEMFYQQRPELAVQTLPDSVKTQQKLDELLTRFSKTQEFHDSDYSWLNQTQAKSSWFLIAAIENSRVDHDLSESAVKDDKGHEIGKKISLRASRSVDVRYFIYEPRAHQLVFSGLIHSKSEAIHDRVTTASEESALLNFAFGTQHEIRDTDYPEAPSPKKSLLRNFEQFLHSLPKTQEQ